MDDLANLKAEFLTEAREHLAAAEEDILVIETQGSDSGPEVINRLFRAMHSIKGGSAFLNMTAVMELAHALENVMDNIRKNKIIPSSHITDLLLKGVDKLKALLNQPQNAPPLTISRELSDIEQVLTSPVYTQDTSVSGPEVTENPPGEKPAEPSVNVQPEIKQPSCADTTSPAEKLPENGEDDFFLYKFRVDLVSECDKKDISLEDFLKNCSLMGDILRIFFDSQQIGTLKEGLDDRLILHLDFRTIVDDPEILMEALAIEPLEWEKIKETPRETPREKSLPEENLTPFPEVIEVPLKTGKSSAVPLPPAKKTGGVLKPPKTTPSAFSGLKQNSSTIRISLSLLDKLMDYASELVLVRNQNMQAVESGDLDQLRGIAKKLNHVTSGLQAGILKTRMQPVETVFTKFPRVVRDMGRKLEKEVVLEIEGKDVELDKNIIEALGDPLTHLVRNAVDHGIESPEERVAEGKERCGKILLGAYHKAGHVNIIIRDDGKGMNPRKLIAIAVNKGVINRKQAETLGDEEALKLIFKPGFSTAGEVTDLSGRGVGMDVVKTNLQRIGGVVHIHSKEGQGSTFDIRLPLTLSIMQALIVLVEDICFAVPQFNISEIVRLYGEDMYSQIKIINDQEIYSLRGKLIPLIRLVRVLKIRKTYEDPRTHQPREDRRIKVPDLEEEPPDQHRRQSTENSLFILVLNLGTLQCGLIIDTIIDTEEIVIKPLHEHIKNCRVYAGTTVLGDGRIAMILDIANLADLAHFNIDKLEKINKKELKNIEDKQTVITFNTAGRETFAIHLFLISHIEKLKYTEIMMANNKEYFKFQDDIIRLIRLEEALDSVSANYLDEVFVIIIKGRRPIGILVSQIIDTTLISSNVEFQDTSRPGIIGVLMLNGELTMMLDIFTIINTLEPGWFLELNGEGQIPRKILLLEDTRFYASLIMAYLSGTGVEVVHGKNGKEGIELLTRNTFDLVISDLTMPVMDGFEFAAYVRSHPEYRDLMLIAISAAYSRQSGKEIALEAGFNEYVSKLDREGMLDCFKHIFQPEGVV